MSELFVSYDLALQLKEKGFKRQLDIAGNLTGYNLSRENKRISYYHVHTQFPSDKEFLYAPLYQQVQKWMRDNHKLYIQISLVEDTEGISESFECVVVDLKKQNYAFESTTYLKTYEEALDLGLDEALKLI